MGNRNLEGQAIAPVLEMFDQAKTHAQKMYRSFVADGISSGRRDELVGGGLKRYLKLSGSDQRQAYDERVLGSGEFVEHLWQEIEESTFPDHSLGIDEIIGEVANVFGVEANALYGRSKRKNIAVQEPS